jgi:hypothetical protein
LEKAGLENIKTVCGYAFLKAGKWERSLKTKKASKSFDLEALKLADQTRLELATSAVTGRHSNQLNY